MLCSRPFALMRKISFAVLGRRLRKGLGGLVTMRFLLVRGW